jgi:hypothetical protein
VTQGIYDEEEQFELDLTGFSQPDEHQALIYAARFPGRQQLRLLYVVIPATGVEFLYQALAPIVEPFEFEFPTDGWLSE